jgi:hypothetical protein
MRKMRKSNTDDKLEPLPPLTTCGGYHGPRISALPDFTEDSGDASETDDRESSMS